MAGVIRRSRRSGRAVDRQAGQALRNDMLEHDGICCTRWHLPVLALFCWPARDRPHHAREAGLEPGASLLENLEGEQGPFGRCRS
jgi:hypothetical protein